MPRSAPERRILFVDHTAALGDAELSLLDIAIAHRGRGAVAIFEDGPFAAALVANNVALIPIEMRKGRRALSTIAPSARAAYALSRVARTFGVLYANSPSAFLVSAVAGLLGGRPVVWHLREMLDREHLHPLRLRLLISLANVRASRVVTNSQVIADAFVAAGGRRQLTRVIYEGIDTSCFDRIGPEVRGDVRQALGIDEHVYVIGSFDDRSATGQRVLLDALEMLPDVLALVVGSAFGRADEEARLIAACDVLVTASNSSELSYRTLVKALLGRRPVVTSDVSGVREIVEDGVTGILVPPGDSAALAVAIRALRSEPIRGDELAFAGSQDARRRFSRASMHAHITKVVDEVLRVVSEPVAP
jgi:glycosyltransferase involved in cell wall biosynthesis